LIVRLSFFLCVFFQESDETPRSCTPYDHPRCGPASCRAGDAECRHAAQGTKLRSSKYLNNLVERDHRGIESRTRPMLGFKRTSTPPTSPLPGSNCFTVSAKDSSHSVDSNSKIKLRQRFGTQSLQHKSHLSLVPHCDHFTYLHQSPIVMASATCAVHQ
jgi:hypothetical protein